MRSKIIQMENELTTKKTYYKDITSKLLTSVGSGFSTGCWERGTSEFRLGPERFIKLATLSRSAWAAACYKQGMTINN